MNHTAAQPLDLDKLLPCPFCGGTETFVERLDYSAAYVQCDSRIDQHSACLARGPVGVQDDDGEEIPGAAAAIRAWNNQAALIAQARAAHEKGKADSLNQAEGEVKGATAPVAPASAQPADRELIDLLKGIRPQYGAVGSRDVDVAAQQKRIDRTVELLERGAQPDRGAVQGDERALFESWYAPIFKGGERANMGRRQNGEYVSTQDQIAWMSWRAAQPDLSAAQLKTSKWTAHQTLFDGGEIRVDGKVIACPKYDDARRLVSYHDEAMLAAAASPASQPVSPEVAHVQQEAAPAELCIGVSNNDEGVHINVMQRHADGSATVLHSANCPKGDSFGRFTIAAVAPSDAKGKADETVMPKPWREAFRDTYPNLPVNEISAADAFTWAESEIKAWRTFCAATGKADAANAGGLDLIAELNTGVFWNMVSKAAGEQDQKEHRRRLLQEIANTAYQSNFTSAADAKDAARLDWLMANNSDHSLKIKGLNAMGWFVYDPHTGTSGRLFATSREAIDAAMAAAPSSAAGTEGGCK